MLAIVIDTSTASGAATLSGRQNASKGTATNASPKPNAERINAAINRMSRTCKVVASIAISDTSRINHERLTANVSLHSLLFYGGLIDRWTEEG
jgi:hypothetical protein